MVGDGASQVSVTNENVTLLRESRIALEGYGRTRSAVVNTAMPGKLYRVLVERSGLGYSGMTQAIHPFLAHTCSGGFSLDRATFPRGHNEALIALERLYPGDPVRQATALVYSTGSFADDDVTGISNATGLKTGTELRLVGGWNENAAVREVLKGFGYNLVDVPNAREATIAGVIAEARFRAELYQTFEEALESVPPLIFS